MLGLSVGLALLGLVLVDVFGTVFHAQGVGGPLNRIQNRAIWALFRTIGCRGSSVLLAAAAPCMIVVTLLGWFVALTIGFALVYLPWIETFLFSPEADRPDWIEALYFSGYTAATLGLGDMVPDLPALRLLTPIQAFSGFSLVSVSVTYLLSTYRELIAMRTTAGNIANDFSANASGSSFRLSADDYHAMARWAEGVTATLLQVLHSHFQYPVLHYFRPSNESSALPIQLDRLRTFLRSEQEVDDSIVANHPSFRALDHALDTYVSTVETRFVPSSVRRNVEYGDSNDVGAGHDRLLRYMCYRRGDGDP